MSFEELLPFLTHQSKKVRSEAVKIILGLSEDASFIDFVAREVDKWSQRLLSLALEDGLEEALSSLVNLAVNPTVARHLGQLSRVTSICEALIEAHLLGPESTERLLLMILTNVTRESQGVRSLLDRDLFVMRLFGFYGDSLKGVSGSECTDKCGQIGHIFINMTTLPDGRKWFVETTADDWEILSSQTRIASRRPVVLQSVKNICCDLELLSQIDYDRVPLVQLLSRLIYPTAETLTALEGSLSADRRSDQATFVHSSIKDKAFGLIGDLYSRQLVADCWCALLRDARARGHCRKLGVYDVFRIWHILETDRDILSMCEDIVHLVHYSEEELAEQDAALIKSQKPERMEEIQSTLSH